MGILSCLFSRPSRRKDKVLSPPEGLSAADLRIEKSICTGEAVIGFYHAPTGRLLQAVAVRSPGDVRAYCRSYGLDPPENLPRV